MDGHIMRCGSIGSSQSAATSEIIKVPLVASLTHVIGAIASVQTFSFLPFYWSAIVSIALFVSFSSYEIEKYRDLEM